MSGQAYGPQMPPGMVTPGNIDVYARPVIENPDGSISTVRSMGFEQNGRQVLVPGVSQTSSLTPDQAWRQYLATKQHLGIFSSPEAADSYAQWLHEQQAGLYSHKK